MLIKLHLLSLVPSFFKICGSLYLLSFSIFFTHLNSIQIAILRGLQKIKIIAISTFLGNFFSVLFSIILIYFFRENGIIPSFFISSVSLFLVNYYHIHNLNLIETTFDYKFFAHIFRKIIFFGSVLTLASTFTVLESYLVKIYIREYGPFFHIGLYSSGFTIVNSLYGIIFSTIVTEYYPKLISLSDNKKSFNALVNEQSNLSLILLTPFLIFLILYIKFFLPIIYTQDYISIANLIVWSLFGLFFKIVSLPIGLIFISKGDTKFILINELTNNFILLILNIFFYKYFRLDGLGISFFISSIINFFITFLIVKSKYDFYFTLNFFKITLQYFFFLIFSCLVYFYTSGLHFIIYSSIFLFILFFITMHHLNKMISFKKLFNTKKNNYFEKN